MPRHMALATLVHPTGYHPASWRHPDARADGSTDIDYYRGLAQLAEKGFFDLFFIADTPAARTSGLQTFARAPLFMNVFEPITLLSAIAGATRHIGLGGTASTSFAEPYNIARQFASLDHISHGRAAWNVVTSANDFAARNFGLDRLPPHAERYARAREFVQVVKGLWDSWEDEAFIRDKEAGLFLDPLKQHPVQHEGAHFRVHGALNIARAPQGHPVIIQAGASDTGKDFAAETAEVVFSSEPTPEAAKHFHDDLKSRMARFGREPGELKVLAGLPVLVADSAQEAEDMHQELQALIHPDVGVGRLAMDLEADLSGLDLDQPIPEDRIPKQANFHKAYFDHITGMIREGLTLRQLYLRYERGNRTLRGTPKDIADTMQAWFEGGACDGFMLLFNLLPRDMEAFIAKVVPELQRRGLMRSAYSGSSLRENLGLARPPHPAR
ncbi:LLM class flavin-dependent oxidoreductase [Acetobacteraceae bacterium H6797]|nr:LLM class flavin-dependent oxidoreductase [Acetobacteraceae bacterium H6797]